MKRTVFPCLTLAMAAIVIAGCSEPTTPEPSPRNLNPSFSISGSGAEKDYVIVASSNSLRKGLIADIETAGGKVKASFDKIGVIVASSDDPGFEANAAAIAGVQEVALDLMVQWVEPTAYVEEAALTEADVGEQSHAIGEHETFRRVQWAPDAVKAPGAWAKGALGAGARVAILDGAIHNTHIDIAPRLDVARSKSFTQFTCNLDVEPKNCNDYNVDRGTFWHGTHVAGIVAAPSNNIGTVGIAPDATIIGVKVLHNGSGAFSWVIAGIMYAATPIAQGGAGAHIINMSLGAGGSRQDFGKLANAIGRATTYAHHQGVLVIAAAGNAAIDFNHTGNVIFLPALSPHVVSVAATGPLGWGLDATVSLDRPASYTNFGSSKIELAGPGGDFMLPGNAFCTKPRLPTGTVTQFCWALDMVMAPCRGGPTSISSYCWAAGTSMASPAVAGVAALIRGKFGPMNPNDILSRLKSSADDINKPGKDDYAGNGRVNATRAVQ